MYKVIKERGNNANVTLMNCGTGSSIIIGRLTTDIIRLLEAEGFKFDEHDDAALKFRDRWELEVSADAAKELSSKAMKMKRPVRKVTEQPVETPVPKKKNNKEIDAMDVLLGLASYN